MGWTFFQPNSMTKESLIGELTRSELTGSTRRRTLAFRCTGKVLWSVVEVAAGGGAHCRAILCHLLEYNRKDHSWGYKPLCESSEPYYYDCPLEFLDQAEEQSSAWREKVRDHHARMKRKVSIGDTLTLPGFTIPHVTIERLRPLRGRYQGQLFRIPRRALVDGEILQPRNLSDTEGALP